MSPRTEFFGHPETFSEIRPPAPAALGHPGVCRTDVITPANRRGGGKLNPESEDFCLWARFRWRVDWLGFKTFFANPYSSWERGTNENTNGLIRQYVPKGTDLSKLSYQRVARIAAKLNNRPRKCLGYRTPAEVLGPVLRL